MSRLTAEQFADKQARNLKNAQEDIRIGVENVTESPMQKAIAKKGKMRANIIAAIDDGKWERGLGRVSLDQWKTAVLDKGIGRIAAGIDGARDKVIAFANELLPYQDAINVKLNKMPDTTLQDSIQRMVFFTTEMAKFKRRS